MQNLELIIATFDDETKAASVLESIKKLKREQYIEVRQAAVIVKKADGEILVNDIEDVDSESGKKFGAIAGGLIGLLGGGPIGAAIGAAAGAATGKAVAGKFKFGVSDRMLEDIQTSMQPGSSAIITVARIPFLDVALRELRNFGAEVFHQTVDASSIPGALYASPSQR